MDEDANQKSDYQYDVFISYSRNGMVEEIVKKHLYQLVKEMLENALEDREASIFVDFDGIQYGKNYKDVLENALSRSIIFVPVIDAVYFRRDWCRKELCVAYEKQQEISYRDESGGTSLIFPVIVKDYETPPEKLEDIQNFDIKKQARTGDPLRIDLFFSEDFDRWANGIAEVLRKPPSWEKHWSNTEWIDNAIEKHIEDMKLGPKRRPDIGRSDV